ncbi:SidA/IucD/PvdA family monooxygenase [Rhizobacter sp. P5_C2]
MAESRQRKEIAVIGGGAKAAALAAKAFALRQARKGDEINVTIFERQEVGAHWTGKSGYTDGIQRLCTPAERDVGFPYASKGGEQVDSLMHAQFSWQSYLLSRPRDYSRWVDHGARPPMHRDFASYLTWVVRRSAATLVVEEVTRLHPARGKWVVVSRRPGSRRSSHAIEFDGVVVTSPGPARHLPITGKSHRRFDGDDFWRRLKEVPKLVRKGYPSEQIVIVGAGGTAAAILAWLCRNGFKDHEIVMVANQAAFFTRGDSVFENRLFSDEETWRTLSKESREQFFNRLNRGVVWGTVMEEVASATGLVFVDGRALSVKADREGSLQVTVRRGDGVDVDLRPAMLVDASGFDNWWFLDLIEGFDAARRNDKKYQESLRDGMEPDLSFSKPWTYPRLHAPAHSSLLGPGYGSLMSLGGMSDLILSRYTNRPE